MALWCPVQLGWFVDGLLGQANLTYEETNKQQINLLRAHLISSHHFCLRAKKNTKKSSFMFEGIKNTWEGVPPMLLEDLVTSDFAGSDE